MIVDILLFLLCPVLSFFHAIKSILYCNKNKLVYVSLFMALCAIISPPFADLSNHAAAFARFQSSFSSDDFIQTNGRDFVIYTLFNFFAKNGVNFDLVRGILVFICYQISFSLFNRLTRERQDLQSDRFLFFCVFLCFFLSVPFLWIINGMRSATSDYIMIYAWMFACRKKVLPTILWAFIGVGTHFFSSIFIPFLFIPFFNRTINKKIFIVLFFITLVLGYRFLGGLFEGGNNSDIGSMANSKLYLEALNYSKLSFNGLIALILERSPIIFLVFFSLFSSKKWHNKNEQTFFYACILLINLCLTYFIPLQRISWLVAPIMIYLFIKNFIFSKTWLLKLLIASLVLSQLAYIWGYREVFINTPFYYLFFTAFFSLFHTYPLNYRLLF